MTVDEAPGRGGETSSDRLVARCREVDDIASRLIDRRHEGC